MKNDIKLYIVMLGGRSKESNIEIHDIRWVIGKDIKETLPKLRSEWLGELYGLHIDSYKQIKYIDGYLVKLSNKNILKRKRTGETSSRMKLWFINLGGYDRNHLDEQHFFTLKVASSADYALKEAKKKWDRSLDMIHKDDLKQIDKIIGPTDYKKITQIGEYKIELTSDPLKRSQELTPDWFGYWRIDH